MKRYLTLIFLLGSMLALLRSSDIAAAAVREGLALCAASVVPSLFPFMVLSSLFVSLNGMALLPQRLLLGTARLLGCSPAGTGVFFLSLAGGYPLGARLTGQLLRSGQISQQEAQHLLYFVNNSGPAFILGLVGLGCFSQLRTGVCLYLIHAAAAALTGLLFRRIYTANSCSHVPPPPQTVPFSTAWVDAVASSGSVMVDICAFVTFFCVLLRLLRSVNLSHPLLLGAVELTQGIVSLSADRRGFLMAAALLGWGGISVHCQTAAVLQGTALRLRPYLCAKLVHAALSAVLAGFVSLWLWP